ncbi:tyrosine-type recombinase/integrase [Thermoflavifilum thermophilum]|uniref:Integrase/recombinase XerC n=1 Tax=Thermoflavifilum thermophilum TaxID=1393122 RepID=A0A1I7NFI3_9BACT|nr:tyrosine-type recombinase/integrase [Thermoflavifilum thermophilum]SFV33425.1 integrase/recombinase XerC [Thermoflavifilum thermophilum]
MQPETSIQEQLQRFLQHLAFEKRYSRHTLTAYRHDIEDFLSFLTIYGTFHEVRELSAMHVRSWVAELAERSSSAATIRRKLSAVRCWLRYAHQQGWTDHDPFGRVVLPRKQKRLPAFLKREEVDRLFHTGAFPEGIAGITHRLILALFYQTGMRLSELAGLKQSDWDRQQHWMRVLGKGSKYRFIPLGPGLEQLLLNYQQQRQSAFGDQYEDWLVLTEKGKPLYVKYLYRIVHRYLTQVSTLSKASPHVLRHTFATHLLNAGADLQAIRELLGHSSLAATQVYVHNSIAQLKEIHKQAHPRG